MASIIKRDHPHQVDLAVRTMQLERLKQLEQTVPVSVSQSRVIVKSMQHLWKTLNTPMSFEPKQQGQ
ncbi:MAG: hypothetical protein JKY67_22630 [Pseudomonadales bacterium]|nr:hypothetical protein [Pseudomonadales bacterium]